MIRIQLGSVHQDCNWPLILELTICFFTLQCLLLWWYILVLSSMTSKNENKTDIRCALANINCMLSFLLRICYDTPTFENDICEKISSTTYLLVSKCARILISHKISKFKSNLDNRAETTILPCNRYYFLMNINWASLFASIYF